jgi:hypothetical protein
LTKNLIHGLMKYYQNANVGCSYEITIKYNPTFSQVYDSEKVGFAIINLLQRFQEVLNEQI